MTKILRNPRKTVARLGGDKKGETSRGPHAIVDEHVRVRAASGISELLLAHGIKTPLVRLLSGTPKRDLARAIQASQAGGPALWTLWIAGSPKRRLTFRIVPGKSGTLLKLVQLAVGASGARQLSYEVTSSERNFGRLLAVHTLGQRLPTVGLRCYEQLGASDVPCAGCPVQALRKDTRTATGVLSDQNLSQWVAHAERLTRTTALVHCLPLAETDVSQIVRGRIERVVRAARLSTREEGVLDLLLLGRSLQQIAGLLGITPRTVRFHVGNILTKIGADSRADLVRLML